MLAPTHTSIPAAPPKAPTPQQGVLWNDIPWIAWNVLLFVSIYAMNSDIPGSPWFVVARVFFGTFIVKLLPPGHLSAFPYSGHFILVALIPYSYRIGGWWSFLTLYIVFGVLPISDAIVGTDRFNPSKDLEASLARDAAFKVATFAVVAVQLGIICWGCWAACAKPLAWHEFMGLGMSIGIYTGGLGITVSHELSHKGTKLEQWLGRLLVVTVSYGHFYVEHVLGHHKHIGCAHDPATARYGETFYQYLPRVVAGEFRSACAIEAARVKEKHLPWWHNEMYWYSTSTVILVAVLCAAFGRNALPLFLLQSATAILLFELVNYLEHYGLERRVLPSGDYEDVHYRHSWDSAHRLTNMLLFKLQRHGDHHVHGGKRYQCLKVFEESPQLPSGYPGCIVLALIPPVWRAVMHPRLMAHRARVSQANGQVWKYGPQPA